MEAPVTLGTPQTSGCLPAPGIDVRIRIFQSSTLVPAEDHILNHVPQGWLSHIILLLSVY